MSGRNSQAVTPVLIHFFQGIKNAKSITVDRGREFAKYDEIEEVRIHIHQKSVGVMRY